jgi:hypothetical protein
LTTYTRCSWYRTVRKKKLPVLYTMSISRLLNRYTWIRNRLQVNKDNPVIRLPVLNLEEFN